MSEPFTPLLCDGLTDTNDNCNLDEDYCGYDDKSTGADKVLSYSLLLHLEIHALRLHLHALSTHYLSVLQYVYMHL